MEDNKASAVMEETPLVSDVALAGVPDNGTNMVADNSATMVAGNGSLVVAENGASMIADTGTTVVADNATAMAENLQVCPLCKSYIKLFYVNFKEQLLMCENAECEYPFGYAELQYVAVEPNRKVLSNQESQKRTTEDSTSVSKFSSNTLADVQKLIEVHEMEDSQNDNRLNEMRLLAAEKEKEKTMKKNIENMKELQVLWNDCKEKPTPVISNEKWIKNLISIQEMSGVCLLKEEEMRSFKKKKSEQLSIDINLTEENNSVIEINLINKDDSQTIHLENIDVKRENRYSLDS